MKPPREIRTITTTAGDEPTPLVISGWLDGPRRSYLWFGFATGACVGTLEGPKLWTLARKLAAEAPKPKRKAKR